MDCTEHGVIAAYPLRFGIVGRWRWVHREPGELTRRPVRTVLVVVDHALGEELIKMSTPKDQHSVETEHPGIPGGTCVRSTIPSRRRPPGRVGHDHPVRRGMVPQTIILTGMLGRPLSARPTLAMILAINAGELGLAGPHWAAADHHGPSSRALSSAHWTDDVTLEKPATASDQVDPVASSPVVKGGQL